MQAAHVEAVACMITVQPHRHKCSWLCKSALQMSAGRRFLLSSLLRSYLDAVSKLELHERGVWFVIALQILGGDVQERAGHMLGQGAGLVSGAPAVCSPPVLPMNTA